MMTHTLERTGGKEAAGGGNIAEIAEITSSSCLATRVRQLSRIITRLYDDALRHLGAARTGAYFSTAPFVGSIVAVVALEADPFVECDRSRVVVVDVEHGDSEARGSQVGEARVEQGPAEPGALRCR